MRIHEIDYQINKEEDMQARTRDYKNWEDYIEYCKYNYNTGMFELVQECYQDNRLYILVFKRKNTDVVFRHKAYILENE